MTLLLSGQAVASGSLVLPCGCGVCHRSAYFLVLCHYTYVQLPRTARGPAPGDSRVFGTLTAQALGVGVAQGPFPPGTVGCRWARGGRRW